MQLTVLFFNSIKKKRSVNVWLNLNKLQYYRLIFEKKDN